MRLYNTLTRKKEEFIPITAGKVGMYVCGPTVYNDIHIGNARPMIVFDTVRRYFEYKGYEVNYVSNFTDVDDKIIKKAAEEGVSTQVITERYIQSVKEDMAAMNVREATYHPKATEEINGMIEMIQTLIDKGHAYEKNGTVYYRTRSFDGYGKLSKKNIDDLEAGHRDIKVSGEEEKEDFLDFVLWKPKKPGEPFWVSPWGEGRPGWHIECSVMSKKYLGNTIDIHAGGEDLIFPHHENEIAQSEAANEVPFANYWIHNGFLNIDNKKMSKSEGNFFTIKDISEKYSLQVLRFFMLSAHYRSPLNFSRELMEASKNGLERILTAVWRLQELEGKAAQIEQSGVEKLQAGKSLGGELSQEGEQSGVELPQEKEFLGRVASLQQKFEAAMEDDFNTADAVSAIFEIVKEANLNVTEATSKEACGAVLGTLEVLCDVLGIITEQEEEILDADIEALIEERQRARKEKNFARADEIRDALLEKGILLEDTREGVKWKRK